MQPPSIYLYAIASPYTFECIEIAIRAGIDITAFVHNMPEYPVSEELVPLLTQGDLKLIDKRASFVIPLITPGHRKLVEAEIRSLGFSHFSSLIDPTSVIASSTTWEEGFQVNAGAVIGAKSRFGRHVQVNRSASIGHDVIAGDYVSFGPACVICGSCQIGDGTFIGANATILPKIKIGKNAIIGAGAVVSKDVPDHTLVAGNPATVIKTGILGYNNTSV